MHIRVQHTRNTHTYDAYAVRGPVHLYALGCTRVQPSWSSPATGWGAGGLVAVPVGQGEAAGLEVAEGTWHWTLLFGTDTGVSESMLPDMDPPSVPTPAVAQSPSPAQALWASDLPFQPSPLGNCFLTYKMGIMTWTLVGVRGTKLEATQAQTGRIPLPHAGQDRPPVPVVDTAL